MKNNILSAFLIFSSFAVNLPAGEKAPAADETTTYSVEMSGMICAGCKYTVSSAFKKLEGVSKVVIEDLEKPKTHKVTITSTASDLSREMAIESLGELAKRYNVVAFKKADN